MPLTIQGGIYENKKAILGSKWKRAPGGAAGGPSD
jgi:hypothetical protein